MIEQSLSLQIHSLPRSAVWNQVSSCFGPLFVYYYTLAPDSRKCSSTYTFKLQVNRSIAFLLQSVIQPITLKSF
jgi:hypothetical protein